MTRAQIRFLLKHGLLKRKLGWKSRILNTREPFLVPMEHRFVKETSFFGIKTEQVYYVQTIEAHTVLEASISSVRFFLSNAPIHYRFYPEI